GIARAVSVTGLVSVIRLVGVTSPIRVVGTVGVAGIIIVIARRPERRRRRRDSAYGDAGCGGRRPAPTPSVVPAPRRGRGRRHGGGADTGGKGECGSAAKELRSHGVLLRLCTCVLIGICAAGRAAAPPIPIALMDACFLAARFRLHVCARMRRCSQKCRSRGTT